MITNLQVGELNRLAAVTDDRGCGRLYREAANLERLGRGVDRGDTSLELALVVRRRGVMLRIDVRGIAVDGYSDLDLVVGPGAGERQGGVGAGAGEVQLPRASRGVDQRNLPAVICRRGDA